MPRTAASPERSVTRAARRVLLGVVVVVSLVLLVLWRADSPRIERLRMALADRLLPGIDAVGQPLAFLTALTENYRSFLDLHAQNRELRREVQRLKAWREVARALEEENAQLRALNHVRLAPRTTFVTGDVIADSGGPFLQSALINVGMRDGVTDGSAVVDGSGLVGRVVGVGERATRLLLLTDFSSRVPVMIRPSGRRAILAGDGTSAPKLEFLESPDGVSPGDLIETTGDGGVFPPGLPVGRMVAVPTGGWRAALAADYARLEFVRVLLYAPDTEIEHPGGIILDPDAPPRPPEAGPDGTPLDGEAEAGTGAGTGAGAPVAAGAPGALPGVPAE